MRRERPTKSVAAQKIGRSRRHGHSFRPATQPYPLVPLPQVDLGQVVLIHQLDELAHFSDVEHIAGN
jgi:hypothetical protein